MSSTNVPCGREQRGVVRLPVLEARGVVHGDVLDGGQRAGAAKLDLAHVAHVEQAHAGAHGQVLGDEAAAGTGILDRHIPAAEVDHLGLERAMGGVEGGLFERGRGSFGRGRGGSGHGESSFREPCFTLLTIGMRRQRGQTHM